MNHQTQVVKVKLEDDHFTSMITDYYCQPHHQRNFFTMDQMMRSPNMKKQSPGENIYKNKSVRRQRMTFDNRAKSLMESIFSVTQYPDNWTREQIAIQIAQDEDRVSVWFKNRRAKQMRLDREMGHVGVGAGRSRGRCVKYIDPEEDEANQMAARAILERTMPDTLQNHLMQPVHFPSQMMLPPVKMNVKKESLLSVNTKSESQSDEYPNYEMALALIQQSVPVTFPEMNYPMSSSSMPPPIQDGMMDFHNMMIFNPFQDHFPYQEVNFDGEL